MIEKVFSPSRIEEMAKKLFKEERSIKRLDGWFIAKRIFNESMERNADLPLEEASAVALYDIIKDIPLSISDNNIFAGTQRDAFAMSYALINPNFRVATFNGYCDPTAVFNDIEPNDEFPKVEIERVRSQTKTTQYIHDLKNTYDACEGDTAEVAYFVEQVTGHTICDLRPALERGLEWMIKSLDEKIATEKDEEMKSTFKAIQTSLKACILLAERYLEIAKEKLAASSGTRKEELQLLVDALSVVPRSGATNLYEAIQSFLLLWQVMCLEQAPNPFAFSVGNADRIFEPYRNGLSREYSSKLFEHFLLFFNVGDRSWAISQNIIVGGKDEKGNDLTNLTSYALFDAYFEMNFPQPILSVKLHKNTPDEFYREMGRFFFTEGALTPSLFNDDAVFPLLRNNGVEKQDLPLYSIAGCQEPLIMGKDSGNTTNSWLNLGKILELTLNDGKSLLTGEKIGLSYEELGAKDFVDLLKNIRVYFEKHLQYFIPRMAKAANNASVSLSNLRVPFLSAFMGGMDSGIDMRHPTRQGTKYHGSGCLIHGLTVIADSFVAIDHFLEDYAGDETRLVTALQTNFKEDEVLREYLYAQEKFGNNLKAPDDEATRLAYVVSAMVKAEKNYLGNPFRPDYATPSTHLTYGYLVGALPNGRYAREQLNYGTDPLYGEAAKGLGMRVLSSHKLPYECFNGGYASHMGLDPNYFTSPSKEEKGVEFKEKIINPLFFGGTKEVQPFYLYVNVTTPETLRKVLANPKKYAPTGVYIMRIHGTFVNFLDLSPEIQEDIIKRLDLNSTTC